MLLVTEIFDSCTESDQQCFPVYLHRLFAPMIQPVDTSGLNSHNILKSVGLLFSKTRSSARIKFCQNVIHSAYEMLKQIESDSTWGSLFDGKDNVSRRFPASLFHASLYLFHASLHLFHASVYLLHASLYLTNIVMQVMDELKVASHPIVVNSLLYPLRNLIHRLPKRFTSSGNTTQRIPFFVAFDEVTSLIIQDDSVLLTTLRRIVKLMASESIWVFVMSTQTSLFHITPAVSNDSSSRISGYDLERMESFYAFPFGYWCQKPF